MTRWIAVAAMVAVSGCERRAAMPQDAGDSTAVADSAAAMRGADSAIRIDSAGRADSAKLAEAAATTKAATKAPAKVPEIIGHDSAFGPIGSVDSTGKLTPTPAKRP